MLYYSILSEEYKLRGMIHSKNKDGKCVVLIIHGYFSSNKIGPNRLYVDLANMLSEIGYIAVRIDMRGMGESDGKLEQVQLKDHVQDLNNIIQDLKQRYPTKDIILIGHCVGCVSILGYLLKNSILIKQIILLTPMINSERSIRNFFQEDWQYIELKNKGYTYRKGVYADSSFFSHDFSGEKIATMLNDLDIDYIIIIADNDQYIDKEDVAIFFSCLYKKPIIIKNADHNFLEVKSRLELYNHIKDGLK